MKMIGRNQNGNGNGNGIGISRIPLPLPVELSFISDLPGPSDEEPIEAAELADPGARPEAQLIPEAAPGPATRRLGFRFLPSPRIDLPPSIETPRLVMRPFCLEDVVVVHKIYADAEVMKLVGGDPAQTVEHLYVRLDKLIEHQDRRGFSLWAVIDRESGELVGDAGLFEHGGGPEIELGFRFRRDTFGRGFAFEAASKWIELGFAKLTIDRLLGFAAPPNKVGQRTLERLGMSARGMSRRCGRDVVEYQLGRGAYEHRREL
ncbi:MAG: GNAT family N-acetyltransferase [Deltaproteobacteria bacterium]|nr:GNAT family N-acetyltransferase [Deltaproteobacteria bacterium]